MTFWTLRVLKSFFKGFMLFLGHVLIKNIMNSRINNMCMDLFRSLQTLFQVQICIGSLPDFLKLISGQTYFFHSYHIHRSKFQLFTRISAIFLNWLHSAKLNCHFQTLWHMSQNHLLLLRKNVFFKKTDNWKGFW